MSAFTLALFNLTNAAPTVRNISLPKGEDGKPPTFSISEGEPITAQGRLVGTLDLGKPGGIPSFNSLELAYGFAPGKSGGATVLVQFGVAKSSSTQYPYIGCATDAPSVLTESYVIESSNDGYVGIVVIRFVES